MRNIDDLDLTDNKTLEKLRKEVAQDDRNVLIEGLKTDLGRPMPDDLEGKATTVNDRPQILTQIEKLNDLIERSERPRAEVTDWDKIPDVEREWLIPQWMPANTVTMFTGEGGAGKSWLTLQAVCQIACGFRDAFLDPNFKKVTDTTGPRPVIFATYEDEPAEIKRRFQALASGMPWINDSIEVIKRNLHIVDMRGIGSV